MQKHSFALLLLLVLLMLAWPLAARDATISGDYVEARTADIYTGPCFANSEVNLVGQEAVLAWRVREGSWDGVDLGGLGVIAVVRANATLGDPHADPLPARAVLMVDAQASAAQRAALVAFAHDIGGELLDRVVSVASEPMAFELGEPGFITVRAGQVALRTRALNHHDHLCGNEEIFYPPLVPLEDSQPAVTLEHTWSGSGLDATWKSPDKRSAFVGSFVR